MAARLAHIWRHPIKSHGREAIARVWLTAGRTMPWDRVWAVAHEASKFDVDTRNWVPCANFVLGSKAPDLQAISASVDEASATVTLSHPTAGTIVVNPDDPEGAADLVAWSAAFVPANRAAPAFVARAARGMTDTEFPSVSLNSLSSLSDLAARAGVDLAAGRFRGNLWIEGWAPWAEFDLIGKEISIGAARLRLRERIRRCPATTANPATGKVDFDTPGFLEAQFGHRDFGVYAEIVGSGEVAIGDRVLVR